MRKQLLMLACFLLTGCGTGQGQNEALDSGTLRLDPIVEQTGSAGLEAQLTAELQRQLLELNRSAAATQADTPPLGVENSIFDLKARLVEDSGLEEGLLAIELTWTEQLVGDYDRNGEVGMSDIVPLATNFGAEVEYEASADPDSMVKIPVGDPDGDGALNWYLARIDGDKNGVIGLSDVAALAQHWQQRVDGFEVLRKPVSAGDFAALPNASDSSNPTLTRAEALGYFGQAGHQAPRMGYVDFVAADIDYQYRVVPVAGAVHEQGTASNMVQLGVDLPPLIALIAQPDFAFPAKTYYPPPYPNGAVEIVLSAAPMATYYGDLVYSWDFNGDGVFDADSGTSPTITHAYTYEEIGVRRVGVVATDDAGNTSYAETDIAILGAVFDVSPKFINPGETITVDLSGNLNLVNPLVKVVSSAGATWEADSKYPGSLPVFQTVIEDRDDAYARYTLFYGDESTQRTWSIGNGFGLNEAPIAGFQPDKVNGPPGQTTNFDASSTDPGWTQLYSGQQTTDSIVNYEWDFGDDQQFSSTEPLASHRFPLPGTYIVTLTVTDSLDLVDTAQTMVTVFGSSNSWQFTDIAPVNYLPDSSSSSSSRQTSQGGPGGGPGGWPNLGDVGRFELCVVSGQLALAYTELRDGELTLMYTYANNPLATSWSEPVEVYRPVTPCRLGLMDIEGKPAIGYAINNKPFFSLAENTEGSTWASPVMMYDWPLIINPGIELKLIDNRPAALICTNGRSQLFAMADDPLGDSWTNAFFGAPAEGLQSFMEIGGQPAYCSWLSGESAIFLNRAGELNLGPWFAPQYVDSVNQRRGNEFVWNSLVNGRPAYLSSEIVVDSEYRDNLQIVYQIARDTMGLAWNDVIPVDTWMPSAAPQGFISLDGGSPAITYLYSEGAWGKQGYYLAYVGHSTTYGSVWSQPTVLDTFSSQGMGRLGNYFGHSSSLVPMTSMASLGGRPCIAYINPDTAMLTIAVREQ